MLHLNSEPNQNFESVRDVNAREVFENRDSLLLVDVREKDEYVGELGHIEGAHLVILSTLPAHLHELSQERPIVFICRSGARSAQATAFAQQNGRSEVYNMQGGMLRWNELDLPTTREN